MAILKKYKWIKNFMIQLHHKIIYQIKLTISIRSSIWYMSKLQNQKNI